MKKNKAFDAVRMMRQIRDRMSEDMKDLTAQQQIEYIERKSGCKKSPALAQPVPAGSSTPGP